MIQRILNSKDFLAVLLAPVTGTALDFEMPWARDCGPGTSGLERILPSINRSARSMDVCGPEGLLPFDAVHHTLHRLFISVLCVVHLHVAAPPSRKAAGFATLSRCGNANRAESGFRGDPQS